MCQTIFIKIKHTVHKLGPVRLFSEFRPRQSLDRWQIAFGNLFRLDLVNINVYAKFYRNILKGSRDGTSFTFIRIWTSAKPQTMTNSIWQSLGLDLFNIKISTLQEPLLQTNLWCIMSALLLYMKIWCFSQKWYYIRKCNFSEFMFHTKMSNVQIYVLHEYEKWSIRTYVTYENV